MTLVEIALKIAEAVIESLAFRVCGWIGSVVVRAVTFGKLDSGYEPSSDSYFAAAIGFVVILSAVGLVWWVRMR